MRVWVDAGEAMFAFTASGGQDMRGAIPAANASQAGDFSDQTQQGFGQFLQQVTNGRQDVPLIFYCLSTQCWMSNNAPCAPPIWVIAT